MDLTKSSSLIQFDLSEIGFSEAKVVADFVHNCPSNLSKQLLLGSGKGFNRSLIDNYLIGQDIPVPESPVLRGNFSNSSLLKRIPLAPSSVNFSHK